MNDPQPEGHMASHIGRRKFLATLGGAAAAWPLAAGAQQPAMPVIGFLGSESPLLFASRMAAFRRGVAEAGYVEGQNMAIEYRWGEGQYDRLPLLNLTVIQQATSTVPVVFVQVSDPVAQGFVASLTKPGGNLTGFSMNEHSIGGKWLDLLKEIALALARVAVLFNPDTSPQSKFFMRSVEATATSLGVQAVTVPVRTTPDIEPALESFARQPNGGLILPT